MDGTCFPFGTSEEIAAQLKDLAEKSGGDLCRALAISDDESDRVMANRDVEV